MSGSASDVVQGRVYNISVGGSTLSLVTDESFSFDAGEDTSSFDLAVQTTTQTIPANTDPSFSFDLKMEKANKTGLEELGVVDGGGTFQFDYDSRSVSTVTVEVLNAEDGTVEVKHEFNDVLFEFSNIDDSTPVEMSVTGYVNGDIKLAANKSGA